MKILKTIIFPRIVVRFTVITGSLMVNQPFHVINSLIWVTVRCSRLLDFWLITSSNFSFRGIDFIHESFYERIRNSISKAIISKTTVVEMIGRSVGVRTWRRPLSMTPSYSMKALSPYPRRVGAIERIPYRETDIVRDINFYLPKFSLTHFPFLAFGS